ncbi:MAG: hypothetical protein A2860_01130, partial [Candidatus Levybacteria bacterium RIFCSPHIGHO2_01_FULL_37_33]
MEHILQNILVAERSDDYELLDSGDGQKLERYGRVVLSRPDPQALWPKMLSKSKWDDISAKFERVRTTGKWQIMKEISDPWQVTLEGITFSLKLLPSKHIGLFPEQSAQWEWIADKIQTRTTQGNPVYVLNLFGYTGGASLACAKAGAEVTHVDSSKFAVDLAMKNRDLSGLKEKPIRFIVDDVRKFAEREIKRGSKYDIIILDPPVYGKGLKGEVWNIENDLMSLLLRLKNIISLEPLSVMLNGYASGYSSMTYSQMLFSAFSDFGGKVSFGELAIKESSGNRLLSSGIFARWL